MSQTRLHFDMPQDAAVKAAAVTLSNYEKVEGGIVSVHVRGDIGSVQAAVDAGAQAARRVGQLFGVHVIPAPVEEIDEVVLMTAQPAGE